MHFRGTGSLGVDLQEPVNQAIRACDRDRKISQHCKANYGILAEKGIYPQSEWKEIRQVGSAGVKISTDGILEKRGRNIWLRVLNPRKKNVYKIPKALISQVFLHNQRKILLPIYYF